MWLADETGYCDVRIGDFYYRAADGEGSGFENRDELIDSIIQKIMKEKEKASASSS